MSNDNYNVIQICEGLYRIPVRLPDSPLKELNSYFIKGIDEDYLVDTGFNRTLCMEDLSSGLKRVGADLSRISIINTHLHADHTGLNHAFMADGHCIYMGVHDIALQNMWTSGKGRRHINRDLLEGATQQYIDELDLGNPQKLWKSKDMTPYFVPLEDGQILHAANFDIKAVEVPGHTDGNMMFWIEKKKVMLTGDNILFDITPNITISVNQENILGKYIESLKKSREYDVSQAWPGHRNPGDYHKRIEELLKHHEVRLNEIESIIGNSEKPLNAFEITNLMSWSVHRNPDGTIPAAQLFFASGECEAHIDHLMAQGRIVRIEPHEGQPYRTYKLA